VGATLDNPRTGKEKKGKTNRPKGKKPTPVWGGFVGAKFGPGGFGDQRVVFSRQKIIETSQRGGEIVRVFPPLSLVNFSI